MTAPSPPTAADRIAEVRQNISEGALRLAYHAAVPVVIDVGLLNLLRVNFFLDPPEALPFEVEAALLLSPLFREIGDDLYEIEPEVRNVLLIGLQTRYGAGRVRQVAALLEQYTELAPAWHTQPELEQAQQLTALSFIDPARANAWLEDARSSSAGQALGQEWFVAMRQRLMGQPHATTAEREVAAAISRLSEESLDVRLSAIRKLATLGRLPDTDTAPIVGALTKLIRGRTHEADECITPDVQAALMLIGALPHHGMVDLKRAILIGADLRNLDFSHGKFTFAQFRDCLAAGVNLQGADLAEASLEDVQAERADLTGANLRRANLERVSLRSAVLAGADMANAKLKAVDFSNANLRDVTFSDTRLAISQRTVNFAGAEMTGTTFKVRPASRTGSILLVDDDPEWLDLLDRSLPQYRVDRAQAYDEAVEALRRGIPYDVAIVDLNLVVSPKQGPSDMLGGVLLDRLREDYPSTRRIALTGLTPSSVKTIFDRYEVDDLLLKHQLNLSDVRTAVRAALEGRTATISQSRAVIIFYDRADKQWVEQLRGHLGSYSHKQKLYARDISQIKIEMNWRSEIESVLENAAAVVLMLSADFLSSDLMNSDFLNLLQSAESRGTAIISLIVRPSILGQSVLSGFRPINSREGPLSQLDARKREVVMSRVATYIG